MQPRTSGGSHTYIIHLPLVNLRFYYYRRRGGHWELVGDYIFLHQEINVCVCVCVTLCVRACMCDTVRTCVCIIMYFEAYMAIEMS